MSRQPAARRGFGLQRSRSVGLLILLGAVAWPSTASRAQTPAEELLSLVPGEVGACLVVRNLQEHWDAFHNSQWYRQLQDWPPLTQWKRSQSYRNLAAVAAALEAQIGVPWSEIRDKLLGQAVVIAYWPDPPAHPGPGTFVLMTKVSDPDLLRLVLERIDEVQQDSGELLERREIRVKGEVVVERTVREGDKQNTQYHATLESLFVFANRQSAVEELIARVRRSTAAEVPSTPPTTAEHTLLQSPRWKNALSPLAADAVAHLYVNPHAWDEHVEGLLAAQRQKESQASGAQVLSQLWAGLDAWAVALELREDALLLDSVLTVQRERWPTVLRAMVPMDNRPPEFFQRVPKDALVVMALQLSLGPMVDLLKQIADEEGRKGLDQLHAVLTPVFQGRDVWSEVLPRLGPDFGGYIAPRPSAPDHPDSSALGPTALPLEAVIGVAITNPIGKSADQDTFVQDIEFALRGGLTLLAVVHNAENPKNPATLRTVKRDGITITWLEGAGGWPSRLNLAYGLMPGYALGGNSVEALEQFQKRSTEHSLIQSAPFMAWREKYFPEASQLVLWNLAATRRFLTEQEEPLCHYVAQTKDLSSDAVRTRLRRFAGVLTLADAAFLAIGADSVGIRAKAGLILSH